MGYLSDRESANSWDRGWCPQVGIVLKVRYKSFPRGIGVGVDVVLPSYLLAGYKWYRGAHPECVVETAKSHKFEVGQQALASC